jgi:hypothetical protein
LFETRFVDPEITLTLFEPEFVTKIWSLLKLVPLTLRAIPQGAVPTDMLMAFVNGREGAACDVTMGATARELNRLLSR